MDDLEKVIEHLKEIAEYFRGCRSNASFASKAENHFWELQNAASEAAELLKAQEPRVMTLEEVLNTDPDWVVCEFRYGMEVSRHSPKVVKYWANGVKYKYGQTWRCWTAWPTDEQRKAVKWDD
jgi:hypothetical protein